MIVYGFIELYSKVFDTTFMVYLVSIQVYLYDP